MIVEAQATDTTPSHEVRGRAAAALGRAAIPLREVTHDALTKRLAKVEAERDGYKALVEASPPLMTTPAGMLPVDSCGMRKLADACAGWKGIAEGKKIIIQKLEAETSRLQAEVASLRLTLGGKTFSADVPEPVGCPVPGACQTVAEIKRLRAYVESLGGSWK